MGMMDVGLIARRGSLMFPNKTCLKFGKISYTYAQLNESSNRLANSLLHMGVQKGDRISVLLENRLEWFDIFFAIAKIGASYAPVNIYFKPPEVKFLIEDSGSSLMFVGEDLLGTVQPIQSEVKSIKQYICVGETCPPDFVNYSELLEQGNPDEPEVKAGLEDVFVLQYTSGTTGYPKGATHTHNSILWNCFHQIPDFNIHSKDTYLIMPALCWAAGFHDFTLGMLWMGAKNVLAPTGGLNIGNLLETIEKESITKLILMPTILKQVVDYPDLLKYDLSSIQLVAIGGEPVPIPVVDKVMRLLPNWPLMQGYGLSEGPLIATFLDGEHNRSKTGSAGRGNRICEVKIVDDQGSALGPGETGEILLRSSATMIGYWQRPDVTAETFTDGWLHTGDLGKLDEDGFLYIVGRKKEMYVSGALNVYPAEVELVLRKHSKVLEAAVIGVPDPDWGEVGKAFIVLKPGEESSQEEIVNFCKENLAGYKVPKQFEFTHEPLPKTISGKIRKFELK